MAAFNESGILITKKQKLIFRSDGCADFKYIAWDVKDDYARGMRYQFNKLPKGEIIRFNVDNPPPTINFIPILN